MPKFLIIQTAFTGDVVLATAIIEKLRESYPRDRIDFLLRKGNEGLLAHHPITGKVWVWDKKESKLKNLLRIALKLRKESYTHVINVHRFASSGFITWLSGAAYKSGFDKNPLSFCYTNKAAHVISDPYNKNPVHEVQRNQQLIADITDSEPAMPRLYPTQEHYEQVKPYQTLPYVCIAPSSVWHTKQWPAAHWAGLINLLPKDHNIYLLGGLGDSETTQQIAGAVKHKRVFSMAGKLNYLQSAALMQGAAMNYANDSAPLHFATAMDAPVTAVFCSTVPAFGFGPLRPNGKVVEIKERLYCRPCGLHGHKACPEGHFRCAKDITYDQLL